MVATNQCSRGHIPSFDDYLDRNSKAYSFANFQHCDKGHVAVAFGLWWPSAQTLTPEEKPVYSFSSDLDHIQIDGGEFLCVKFQR